MKKILVLCFAALASFAFGAKQTTATPGLKLIQGDSRFINENAKVALFMDFENTVSVEYGKDKKTVERNEGRMLDSIPAEEWKKDFVELNQRMVAYFNEVATAAGKPVRMTGSVNRLTTLIYHACTFFQDVAQLFTEKQRLAHTLFSRNFQAGTT